MAAAAIGAVVALACSTASPSGGSAEPLTLTIGVPQSRQGASTPHTIRTVADPLTNLRLSASDADGLTRPLLVERWTVAEDGLTWRLQVMPGVSFHDGSPLTSGDVKRMLEEFALPPERSSATACLADVTGVTAGADGSLIIRLARPCALLLDDIDYSVTKPNVDGSLIGAGPFMTLSAADDEITLVANPRYVLGRPAIDRVVIRAYDTLREAWADMLRGRVDFLWEVGPDAAEFLQEQASVELRSHLSYFVYTIAFNSGRRPFDQTEVRQALNLAIDRDALLKQALRNRGMVAASPIWPNHWARPESSPALPYAPIDAAARLRAALGRLQRPETADDAPLLTFTCLLPEGFTVYERLALLVQQQLREVGVEMSLEAPPSDTFNARILTGDFDAVLLPLLSGPNLAAHYRFWHSPSPVMRWNFWGYRSQAVDAALESLREAAGSDETRAAVARLDAALRADPPGMALVWSHAMQAVSRRFVVPESGRGRDALHVLWAWTPSGTGGGGP